MLKRNYFIAALSLFCLLATANAQPGEDRRGRDGKGLMQTIKELGVEASVVKQIKGIAMKSRKAQIPLKSAAELAKIELHELLDADNVDEGAVLKAIDKVALAKASVRKQQVKTMLKIRSLLTPEQQAAFKERQEMKRAKREKRRKRRKGR